MKKNIFSNEHIRDALRYSQQDGTKITQNAPVFLAAVLQHVTRYVLDEAYKTNESDTDIDKGSEDGKPSTTKRIREGHLQECFQKDKGLQGLWKRHIGVHESLRFDKGEENNLNKHLLSEEVQLKQQNCIPDCTANLQPALKLKRRRRLSCNKLIVEHRLPVTSLLGSIVISVMGLPGSMKEIFMKDFQRVIEINMFKKATQQEHS